MNFSKKIFALSLCACCAFGAGSAAAYSNADLNRVLIGESCVGGDLSGADLSGMNLCYRDFTGTDFTEARLDGTQLDNALLDNANFTNTLMARASLRHASLNGANFSFATATEADFTKAELQNVTLYRAQLSRSKLQGAALRYAKGEEVLLDGVQADYADFSFANLPYSWLRKASLRNAVFYGTNLYLKGAGDLLHDAGIGHRAFVRTKLGLIDGFDLFSQGEAVFVQPAPTAAGDIHMGGHKPLLVSAGSHRHHGDDWGMLVCTIVADDHSGTDTTLLAAIGVLAKINIVNISTLAHKTHLFQLNK